MLASTDPPAQLVELREPVTLGVLDQHHGRVWNINADLDHCRCDEHVDLAGFEAAHRFGLLRGGHLPVDQRDVEVLKLFDAESLELGGRCASR